MLSLSYHYTFLPFFISLLVTYLVIKFMYPKIHNYVIKPVGPQVIHSGKIPRLGGFSIIICMILMSAIHYIYAEQEKYMIMLYFLVSFPVFIFGFCEDITQSISPTIRLLGSLFSAILLLFIFDLSISNINISLINKLFSYKFFSFTITILCIVYLIQSFNIIDGLNGLSLFSGILCFASVSVISFQLNDYQSFYSSILFIGILMGVLVFNFPFGKIFIGDSGAYVIGLLVSLSVLMLFKNNINVSSLVIAQILVYPSYELLRSCLRRMLVLKKSILFPDSFHLHSVFYKFNLSRLGYNPNKVNSITSLQLTFLQLFNCIYVSNFYDKENAALFGIILFIIFYEIIYYIVKKNTKSLSN